MQETRVKTVQAFRTTLIIFITFVFSGLALFVYQPVWVFHWSDFRTGNEIVSRVEAFRAQHNGVLPETLEETGISD